MSPADSAEPDRTRDRSAGSPLRCYRPSSSSSLQIEVMGVRVDQNLERMRQVLLTGDASLAEPGARGRRRHRRHERVAHRALLPGAGPREPDGLATSGSWCR